MSLATRCPSCGTVFRVVRDQLKVSDGWVRCGRCTEVFKASERLFDLERDGTQASAPPKLSVVPRVPDRAAGGQAPAAAVARVGTAFAPASAPSPLEPTEPRVGAANEASAGAKAAAKEALQQAAPAATASARAATTPALGPDAAEAPTPGFVLQADRAAQRRSPARRVTLALAAVALAVLLVAQIGLHYRDALAAQWPATQPALQAACSLLGCRIEAPRHIEALSVDSSGLARVEGSTLYQLSLVVQNRAPTPVRMPAIELALSDTQGRTMVRRVLSVAELGHSADSLPPRGEAAVKATLELGDRQVAGYTVELFYP